MTRQTTIWIRLASLAALAGLVSGCSSLGAINPFSEREEILPGERYDVLVVDEANRADGSPSIGAASNSDWPQPGGNAANAPGHLALAGNASATAFRARVYGSGKRVARASAPPIVTGGRIFAYDADATVTALSTGGGKAWAVSLKPEGEKSRSPGGGVTSAGNVILAATGYGELVALDPATGGRVWTYDLRAPARSAPTAAGGKAYVVTQTNVLHAVNLADGTEAWSYPGIPENAGVLSGASPAVVGNTVIVPYSSGEVIAFNADKGELQWADAVIRSTRTLAVSGLTDVAASPVVYDGVVYATGVSGRTIAVSLRTGDRIWEQNIGAAATPVVSGNAIFLVDLQDNMVALDRRTGQPFWQTAMPVVRKKRFFSTWVGPVLAGGTLWAVSNDKKLIGVDPASGQITAERSIPDRGVQSPIAAGGRLYIVTADGSLTALQ
ncbi:outer membrane protein assembly factor BamB family protein [Afifella pfennigii]|uniref:outer membrane protein assembly factor BamB family protein n=1 Tax=Afifella pfennigii TaxID=209897 RepID=UPI00047B1BBA|nr:PQQ-binding-like beta-propeller repeat protein [Afifella pfennigii]